MLALVLMPIHVNSQRRNSPRRAASQKPAQKPSEKVEQPALDNLTFTVNGVTFTMIGVQGGTFRMGANENAPDFSPTERPIHNVTLSSFYIGQTEVTQALWEAVTGESMLDEYLEEDDPFYDPRYPAYGLSWDDCQEFIEELNRLTGQKFRLPTEAEWEFAARGGIKSQGYFFSGSNNMDEVGWHSGCEGQMHPVASKAPNELGIYDMSGNVSEWCQDWYDENYYRHSPSVNPKGPSSGRERVMRDSSWEFPPNFAHLWRRFYCEPYEGYTGYGFRLAL